MSFNAAASELAANINLLVQNGSEADEALTIGISRMGYQPDYQADLYARISEAWGGIGLLWKQTVVNCMQRAHG